MRDRRSRFAPSVFGDVLQMNAHDGPVGAQRKLVGPFDDHDRLLCEHVLQPERLQIVEIADAVKVDVIDPGAARRICGPA